MLVGYKRVSAVDQKELRQLEGVQLDKVFLDKASGRDAKRPQLEAMLSFVRDGDTIVCHAMDRLARNVDDLRRIVRSLTDRGVHVRFEKEALTFTKADSPMASLLLSVIGAVAEFERELIRAPARGHRSGETTASLPGTCAGAFFGESCGAASTSWAGGA